MSPGTFSLTLTTTLFLLLPHQPPFLYRLVFSWLDNTFLFSIENIQLHECVSLCTHLAKDIVAASKLWRL